MGEKKERVRNGLPRALLTVEMTPQMREILNVVAASSGWPSKSEMIRTALLKVVNESPIDSELKVKYASDCEAIKARNVLRKSDG